MVPRFHPFHFCIIQSSGLQPITISGLSIEVMCDIIITSSMVYYLVVRRSKVKK
jgi:hypothetical protein